jgi:hypothetical protein
VNKPAKIEKPSGKISIHGREYETVASRVHRFREAHPDWALVTEIVERDAECVVVMAQIGNAEGQILATGHAEEYRKASQINRTSALENAETSAIGRALAALGFGGTEFATANEVQNAIHQQDEPQREKVPGIHKIKGVLNELMRDGNKARDIISFNNMVSACKDELTKIKEANHEYWTGDGADSEGFKAWIQRRRAELAPQDEPSLSLQMLLSVLETCATRNDLSALLDEHGAVAEALDGEESRRWEEAYNAREAAIMAAAPVGAG